MADDAQEELLFKIGDVTRKLFRTALEKHSSRVKYIFNFKIDKVPIIGELTISQLIAKCENIDLNRKWRKILLEVLNFSLDFTASQECDTGSMGKVRDITLLLTSKFFEKPFEFCLDNSWSLWSEHATAIIFKETSKFKLEKAIISAISHDLSKAQHLDQPEPSISVLDLLTTLKRFAITYL